MRAERAELVADVNELKKKVISLKGVEEWMQEQQEYEQVRVSYYCFYFVKNNNSNTNIVVFHRPPSYMFLYCNKSSTALLLQTVAGACLEAG